jgi:hypothetical protein
MQIIPNRLYLGLHWRVWYLARRGRFIAQGWSFTIGPLSVAYYPKPDY